MSIVTAAKLKVTTLLSAEDLLKVQASEQRVVLKVKLPDRELSADIASKSLRKAQSTIKEHGADNVVCLLQGVLKAGDALAEAGLVAQVKQPKKEA